MKFSTREDIERPIEEVFEQASDFKLFRSLAGKRGVSLRGDAPISTLREGQTWTTEFEYRGRTREVVAEVVSSDPGQGYAVSFTGEGIAGIGVVDLLALSRSRTRMFVSLDLRPLSMSARLILQSLKFAKKSLNARFEKRVTAFARIIEGS